MVFLLLIVVLVGLVLGGLYLGVLRRAAPEGGAWKAVALTGLVSSVVAALLTVLAAVLSFTTLFDAVPFRDPLAVVAFLGLPAALVGVGCGALGLKAGARRTAIAGLVLALVSILAWLIMAFVAG